MITPLGRARLSLRATLPWLWFGWPLWLGKLHSLHLPLLLAELHPPLGSCSPIPGSLR